MAASGDKTTEDIQMHDGDIQDLFGVSLQVERAIQLYSESPEEALALLSEAISRLHALIADLRRRIDDLAAHDTRRPP